MARALSVEHIKQMRSGNRGTEHASTLKGTFKVDWHADGAPSWITS